MENHRYPKQCYEMIRQLDTIGRQTWATSVKNLLFMYGFGYVWISHDVGNELTFMQMFKQRINDCCFQKWHEDVNGLSKAHHYKHFKSLLDVETYLTVDMSYALRRVLANFRCSSHVLMIEKGRHLGLDRHLRVCSLCQEEGRAYIEDEYHFFFDCKVYENLREFYFKQSWLQRRNTQTFYSIMSSTNGNDIISVARYLQAAFVHRNTLLTQQ